MCNQGRNTRVITSNSVKSSTSSFPSHLPSSLTTTNHSMSRAPSDAAASIEQRLELLKLGRQEGILLNYLTEDPQVLCRRIPPIHPISDIREPFKFPSEEGLATLPSFAPPMEKLSIDKEAIALLASLQKLGAEGREEEEKLLSEDYCVPKKPRIEKPLLRGEFILPTAKSGIEKVEPLLLNEKDDGGLQWPTSVRREVRGFVKEWQVEKLDMPLEVRDFFKELVRKPDTVDDDELWAEASDPLSVLETVV
jgi:hypothetical protein